MKATILETHIIFWASIIIENDLICYNAKNVKDIESLDG